MYVKKVSPAAKAKVMNPDMKGSKAKSPTLVKVERDIVNTNVVE